MSGDLCDHLGCLQWIASFLKLPSDFGFFQEKVLKSAAN